jgi:hypothetical protein
LYPLALSKQASAGNDACNKGRMGNFQDSRFFGFSGRTIWVTVVIGAVIVGLFFIPETIKFALYSKKSSTVARSATESKRSAAKSESDKASLAPEALKAISSTVSSPQAPTGAPAAKQVAAKKANDAGDDGDRPGLFSGWDFRVKASEAGGGVTQVPSNLSLEKVGTKEFQALVRRSRADVRRFNKKYAPRIKQADEITSTFLDQLELASRDSAKGLSPQVLLEGLLDLHVSTIKALAQAGADRGVVLEWLKLPIVSFIDDRVGLHGMEKIKNYFVPRMFLKKVTVRQRLSDGWGADGRSPVTLQAEMDVRGTDVEKIVVYNNGKKITETRGANVSGDGVKVVRMRGDANGVWTVVAQDKFGSSTYWRSYSFYPKVRRFRQKDNGEYVVAFRRESAPNSLDRYFLVGSSKLRQPSSEATMSMF